MCVRTKTSYGCGCTFKHTEGCGSSRCKKIDRYHYMKEGDCRECKYGGSAVTRGREGKGRYAKEMHRRSPVEIGDRGSPWAAAPTSARREKEWQSPTRRKADSAWEEEHSSRMEELEKSAQEISIRAESPRRVASPEPMEDHYYSQESENERHPRPLNRKLYGEYTTEVRPRGEPKANRHNDSSESFESITPLPQKSHTTRSYKFDDPYDSAYGSQPSHKSHSYRTRRPGLSHSQSAGLYGYGAKTEPHSYSYSSPTSRTMYDIPVSTMYGGYSNPVASYGVELLGPGQSRLVTRRW
ncbi:uncharacterized protein HMPREF1541_02475 [Cyphellophora europaea CBS 101466]|uniref:Uncharacterized protein n=1 Tax=Cyphellophora europaea (strain CBS 101466) TaxID=1220924 RepID=W2S3N6_CYPE1|nr:uncharacterized protein HMPREF1541_02475 [Cyphellophora europaea CBS 101466]ETN43316.1 hypothetical protein HMPREF1541_02475 [Cyphellophora europaea CBS 101466]